MSVEVFPAQRFVYARLDAALSIPIHELPAPVDAKPPFCAIDVLVEPDLTTANRRTLYSPQEWTVRVVGQGAFSHLEPHVGAIHHALHGLVNVRTPDGWVVGSCVRVAGFRPPPYYLGGVRRQEAGGRYRLLIRRE